jgi:hypothetical protein
MSVRLYLITALIECRRVSAATRQKQRFYDNDIASTWERTRTVTATVPSPAIPTTQPIELTGTTPKKVDRIALIYVISTA